MITEDFVSFETAKLLKEKGFDEPFFFYYRTDDEVKNIHHAPVTKPLSYNQKYIDDEVVAAPTLQMVMKRLRKKKGIAVLPILSSILDNERFLWDVKIVVAKTAESYSQGWIYESYERACEAAIKYYLENLI